MQHIVIGKGGDRWNRSSNEDSYQIIKDMPQALEMTESTLYPILRRLKAQGSLSEYAQEHGGRTRKYYTITEQGRRQLAEFAQEEQAIQEILAYVLKGAAK